MLQKKCLSLDLLIDGLFSGAIHHIIVVLGNGSCLLKSLVNCTLLALARLLPAIRYSLWFLTVLLLSGGPFFATCTSPGLTFAHTSCHRFATWLILVSPSLRLLGLCLGKKGDNAGKQLVLVALVRVVDDVEVALLIG